MCHFTDAEAAAQYEQTQGVVERVGDLGKQAPDVLRRQGLGKRAAPAEEVARFDGIDPERLALCRQILKEMLEGMLLSIRLCSTWHKFSKKITAAFVTTLSRQIPPRSIRVSLRSQNRAPSSCWALALLDCWSMGGRSCQT